MKVKDLISKLEKLDPEADVVIPVTFTYVTTAQRPVVGIEHVGKGIDWDHNRVMLHGAKNLVALSTEQFEYFYSELKKADKQRSDAFKRGIKDISVIEKDMNPLFKTESKDAK